MLHSTIEGVAFRLSFLDKEADPTTIYKDVWVAGEAMKALVTHKIKKFKYVYDETIFHNEGWMQRNAVQAQSDKNNMYTHLAPPLPGTEGNNNNYRDYNIEEDKLEYYENDMKNDEDVDVNYHDRDEDDKLTLAQLGLRHQVGIHEEVCEEV